MSSSKCLCQLICKHSWLGALYRECTPVAWCNEPSQEAKQRHECLQINPSGDSEMLRLVVAVFDKDSAIAFTLRLDAKHLRAADTDTLSRAVY